MLFLYTHKSVPCQVIINEATHQQLMEAKKSPRLGVSIGSFPLELGEAHRRGRERNVRDKMVKDTRKAQPTDFS